MASFQKITTEEQFIDYIKLTLGLPIINVEVTDLQIGQIIWDSLEDFRRYNYDEGSYMDYAIITLTAGQTEYQVSAFSAMDGKRIENVQDIYDFGISFGMDGINTMFSPAHILLYEQFVVKGQYPGGGGPVGLTLSNYYVAMQYLDQIKEFFGKYYRLDYIPGKNTFRCIPTPSDSIIGVMVFYRKQYAEYVYNNPLVKKLAVARTKILWGRILNKYGATLPDGITINGRDLIDEGKEEEEKCLENFRAESSPIDFYIA